MPGAKPACAEKGPSMAHPYHHALSSVRTWGGVPDDYIGSITGSMNRNRSWLIIATAHYAITPRAFSCSKRSTAQH